jgi:TetR/AcrR family transcriptional regulator
MHADERRSQLLDKALEVFSRNGFNGTTTKEIAAAAGVTEAVIFRHFPTKLALYKAVSDYIHQSSGFEEWLAELRAAMGRNDDGGVFRTLAVKILAGFRREPLRQRLWLFAALEGHEPILAYNRQLSEPVIQMLTDYIARRQAEGALREYPARAMIALMAGAAGHFAMMTGMFGFPAGMSDESVIEAFTQIMMTGVEQPASSERS